MCDYVIHNMISDSEYASVLVCLCDDKYLLQKTDRHNLNSEIVH